MQSKINISTRGVPIGIKLLKLTCLLDSDVYKAATMDFSSLYLPSFCTIMATTSVALYPASNLVEIIAKLPNCLIATYNISTETHRTESMEWGQNLAFAMAEAWVPVASYSNFSHSSSTHETQFNVNCYLHLVHVMLSDQQSCKDLLLIDFPLSSMYPGSANELVVFMTSSGGSEKCMEAAALKEEILEMEDIGGLHANVLFLKVQFFKPVRTPSDFPAASIIA